MPWAQPPRRRGSTCGEAGPPVSNPTLGGGLLLAVETSCDETGIAVVENGRRIHANVVASQVALHAGTGGIVPEVAARAHLRWIVPVLDEALAEAGIGLGDIDAIAVTEGPGLAGSLLVGINFAKALAYVSRRPLVAVNHLEGHLYAAWLLDPAQPARPEPAFPLVALIVSGGHTFLTEMRDHLSYHLLGQTVDDAAGEAFDKVGRLLGLPYPGGPSIMAAAATATRRQLRLPRAWLGDSFDFSFSGLKTAALRAVAEARATAGLEAGEPASQLPREVVAELAWAFQESVVDVLATKTIRAAEACGARSIVLGGGVAANDVLRARNRHGGRRAGRRAGPAAAGSLYRQWGHDRRGWRPPLCGGRAGRPRARRAADLPAGARRCGFEGGRAVSAAAPRRLDPQAVRRALRAVGIRARHALSQNFLADVDVLEAILSEAAPRPGRKVLEIGPGLGVLTGGLLDAGATVVAVELDRDLARHLRMSQAEAIARGSADPDAPGSLRVVEGDVLDQDLTQLASPPYDVVANLPYHITSPVLHLLLGRAPRPDRLTLMVQREVAERIAASPGRMSYLSVFVQYHARVRIAQIVAREAFEPAPNVESAILVLEPFSTAVPGGRAALDPHAEDELWRLVQAGFRERRKMLHNVLGRQLPLQPGALEAALARTGIDPDRRPQTLSVDEWLALREALGPLAPDRRAGSRGSAALSHPEGD